MLIRFLFIFPDLLLQDILNLLPLFPIFIVHLLPLIFFLLTFLLSCPPFDAVLLGFVDKFPLFGCILLLNLFDLLVVGLDVCWVFFERLEQILFQFLICVFEICYYLLIVVGCLAFAGSHFKWKLFSFIQTVHFTQDFLVGAVEWRTSDFYLCFLDEGVDLMNLEGLLLGEYLGVLPTRQFAVFGLQDFDGGSWGNLLTRLTWFLRTIYDFLHFYLCVFVQQRTRCRHCGYFLLRFRNIKLAVLLYFAWRLFQFPSWSSHSLDVLLSVHYGCNRFETIMANSLAFAMAATAAVLIGPGTVVD